MIAVIGSDREKFRLLDLDLANNSLGAGCGDLLAVALRQNKTLTRLSLRCVTIAFADRSPIDTNKYLRMVYLQMRVYWLIQIKEMSACYGLEETLLYIVWFTLSSLGHAGLLCRVFPTSLRPESKSRYAPQHKYLLSTV